MKKLFILTYLVSLSSFAQNLPMDNLISVTDKNYCYNVSKLDFRNIIDYFVVNDNSVPVIAGLVSKAVSINYPTIKIKKLGSDIAKELLKEYPKKYNEQDLAINPIKNIYFIANEVNFWFDESPGLLVNRLSNQYNGIIFRQDGLGGNYIFPLKSGINLKSAKDIKEYNLEHEKFVESEISFNINSVTQGEFKGGSVLSYQCTVNMVSPLSVQDIANSFKGKILK